jgi:hypothetical protein
MWYVLIAVTRVSYSTFKCVVVCVVMTDSISNSETQLGLYRRASGYSLAKTEVGGLHEATT